jgi:hypothetical protein
MRPFEAASAVLIETLKARHASMKAFAASESRNVAEIAAELEKADKAFAELLRVANLLAAPAEGRSRQWWRRLVG